MEEKRRQSLKNKDHQNRSRSCQLPHGFIEMSQSLKQKGEKKIKGGNGGTQHQETEAIGASEQPPIKPQRTTC